jgi:hypothetical protein
MDQFLSTNRRAACWILAGILLHEGDHQDDDYPWPPTTAEDRQKWHCEEAKAYCKELEVLCEAQNDRDLDTEGLAEVRARKEKVGKLKHREFRLKDE